MTPGKQASRCELSRSNTLHTSGQTRSILGQSQPNFLHPGKSRGLTRSSIHCQKGREGWAAGHGLCVSGVENIALAKGTP